MRFIGFVFYIILSFKSISQIDLLLVKHLANHKLNKEHLYYLQSLQSQGANNDSLSFLLAKYYVSVKNDSLFFIYYSASHKLYNSDTNALKFANYYFLNHTNSTMQSKWFKSQTNLLVDSFNSQIINLYRDLSNDYDISLSLNSSFNGNLKKYNKVKGKSPVIAAGMSAIIPGLGKLYGHRPNSAMITFLSQGISAYQSYESIREYGFKNAFSIFSMSFFGIFYLSNIYGSYHDLKELKQQQKKQLLIDAQKYYHSNYPVSLY